MPHAPRLPIVWQGTRKERTLHSGVVTTALQFQPKQDVREKDGISGTGKVVYCRLISKSSGGR